MTKSLRKGARSMDPDGLSVKERAFVGRYLVHGERARAAREAGLSVPTADGKFTRCSAWNWPRVREVIERELAERRQRYKLEADWVLLTLGYMVRFKISDLYDHRGALIPPHMLPEPIAACVTGIDFNDDGTVRKYHLISKTETMALAMKHLKLLGESSTPPPQQAPVLNVTFVTPPQLQAPKEAPPTIEATVQEAQG